MLGIEINKEYPQGRVDVCAWKNLYRVFGPTFKVFGAPVFATNFLDDLDYCCRGDERWIEDL